jgi:hypothetical protein
MVTAEKTLTNSDVSGARANVPDIKVVGNGDLFRLLCKASSQAEGWMKSSKAMEVPGGCIVQVTTQQRNRDGSYALAEAVTFVPGVQIAQDENGGRKLVAVVETEAVAGPPWRDVAASAYRAYAASTGNKNFRGEPMPAFEELPQAIRTAWEVAVRQAGQVLNGGSYGLDIEQAWQGWTPPQ